MKAALCGLIGVLLVSPVPAADVFEHPRTPAQVKAALARAMPDAVHVEVLRGHYRQQKHLREIPRPLSSTGEFLVARDRGIWWHTLTPLDTELTLSAHPAQQPGLEPAAKLLLALFVLDLEPLARSFDLFLLEPAPAPQWVLGLKPRDAALAAFFEQVIVRGDARVEQVTLFEATGDRTEISLDATAQALSSLTPIERARLER